MEEYRRELLANPLDIAHGSCSDMFSAVPTEETITQEDVGVLKDIDSLFSDSISMDNAG
jgi:hypothetical protein